MFEQASRTYNESYTVTVREFVRCAEDDSVTVREFVRYAQDDCRLHEHVLDIFYTISQ